MPGDGDSSPRGRPVASVARALALLDELGAAPDGLGVNELARRIGVNASTASRLLATLEAGRMVERVPGGPYPLRLRAGPRPRRAPPRPRRPDPARARRRPLRRGAGRGPAL